MNASYCYSRFYSNPARGFYHSHIVVKETKTQSLRKLSKATWHVPSEPEFHPFYKGKNRNSPDCLPHPPKWKLISVSKIICVSSITLFIV